MVRSFTGDSPKDQTVKNHPNGHETASDRSIAKSTGKIAGLTGVLAAIAVVSAIVSFGQWWEIHSGSVDTRNLANAATLQAKIMLNTERPHMLMGELSVSGIRQAADANGKIALHITFKFVNFGKSPALIKGTALKIANEKFLPEPPVYDALMPSKFIVNVGGWWGSVKTSDYPMDASDVQKILSNDVNLFIYGIIKYTDPTGTEHQFRYAYRMIFGAGDASEQFYPDGPDSYWEYT